MQAHTLHRRLCAWRACWALFRIRTAEGLQYRMAALASVSISAFWALLEITVYVVFYTYADPSGAALTLTQVITYAWLAQIMFPLQPMSIDSEILESIQNGNVGLELCRPLDLYMHWFAKTAAGRIGGWWWRGVILLVLSVLMPAAYRLSAPASAASFAAFLLSMCSAFLLCASYGMLITTVRLGVTWGEGPSYVLLLIGGLLSGSYLPLQLWPDAMQGILRYQPFAGYLDLPLRLYLGLLPPGDAASVIALQLGWAAAFIIAGRLLLRRRLRHLIVQGG